MEMIQLQERFIGELLVSAPRDWDRIEVHYERFSWKGQWLEKYMSKALQGAQTKQISLTLEALDILTELNGCIPNGQSEPWTWVEFRLDKDGGYKFDYKYGTPPLAAESIKHAP